MITEDKAIEIFCLEERFSRLFNKMKEKCSVIPSNPTKRRCLCDSRMNAAEIIERLPNETMCSCRPNNR